MRICHVAFRLERRSKSFRILSLKVKSARQSIIQTSARWLLFQSFTEVLLSPHHIPAAFLFQSQGQRMIGKRAIRDSESKPHCGADSQHARETSEDY